jgi:hypothetical protein
MKDQALSKEKCRALRLPSRSPLEPYEPLDWFEFESSTEQSRFEADLEAVRAILGEDRAA